ncbi:MAG: PPC domain-containing protein [Chloroherpetonaceae bacterium]|nr:hypothetical protein [Chthonomonadaceae bacterium]MDW8208336.1 PPC domain-containing protein [Chloroherpetonaceae bacterium]
MKTSHHIRALIALLLASPASAQTSFPMIGSVFPAGVQRGTTTEVTVIAGGKGGANLNGAYRVLFSGTGVTAEIVPPEKGWPAPDQKNPWQLPEVREVKMRVTVAPDAPPGVREFRIATRRMGTSTVGQLVIGDEPEKIEAEPNNDRGQAQEATLPCVINGRIQQGEDVDFYRFRVAAGQTVTFAVLCHRLEDRVHDLEEHADPLIVLYDARGREIARNDDYYRADCLLHYRFDTSGEYFVEIRDVGYKGNPHWVYRLQMTTRPYVTAVVPCAVVPGQTARLRLHGVGLGETQTIELSVPSDVPRGIWTTPLSLPGGVTNPVALLVTEQPQQTHEGAQPASGTLNLPGGVNNVLMNPGQIDRYTFTARKGEAWGFEVTARRLDAEVDTELKIRNMQGAVLAVNDDHSGKDSRIEWTAPEDGQYVIEVRDLARRGGPACFYNLTATRLQPDFRIRCDTDRAMIAPGNRTTWYALVERKHGFAGDVRVEVRGLPPGVTALPVTIPANMTTGTLYLIAAPDAPVDAALVEVVGTATINGASVTRKAHPITEIYIPGGARGLLEVETQALAVTEPNDLEVTASPPQLSLKPGETARIEVEIKRRPDYTKPVTLDVRIQHLGGVFVNPLPPGVSVDDGASKTLLGEGETKGYLVLKVAPDAPPIRDWNLAILANVSINFVMKVWYAAPPVSLTVEPAEKK